MSGRRTILLAQRSSEVKCCENQGLVVQSIVSLTSSSSEVKCCENQGLVVQSIVSLTSSLSGQLVKCFTTL